MFRISAVDLSTDRQDGLVGPGPWGRLGAMALTALLRSRGGITRTSVLLRAGAAPGELRAAITKGQLLRPRKGWVALPGTDPELLTAARRGALLSCVTQAARAGLWTLAVPREPHYAPPNPHSHVVHGPGVVHWRVPPVPRAPGQLEDGIENTLVLVAECQPYETALAVVESALNRGLTSIAALELLPSPRLRALAQEATPFADSGVETIFRSRLGWLRIPIRVQTHLSGHRVDVLIGERLVIQVDGKQHSGAQRDADILHDAELRRQGYEVIRVTYSLIVHHWEEVQDAVLAAIARGLHLRPTR